MNTREDNHPSLGLEDYLLLAAVILLPWAFGGVEIWAYRSAGLLLVASAAVAVWKRSWAGLGLGLDSRWLIPAFLLALWGGLQIVPLPPRVIQVLSPQAHQIYSEAFPWYPNAPGQDPVGDLEEHALLNVPEAVGRPFPAGHDERLPITTPECLSRTWKTISLEPTATLEKLLWYVALLLGFLVLRERVRHRSLFRVHLSAILVSMVALAAFALIQSHWWNGKIFWFRRMLVVARPFGPYFNPTNLAGMMELAIPALVGYAWWRVRRFGRQALFEAQFPAAAVGAAVCLVAGLGSASKAGAALIIVSLGMMAFLGVRTLRWRLGVLGVSAVVLVAAGFLLSETRLAQRMETYLGRATTDFLLEGRLVAWEASLPMIQDFPLIGTGFGTFREIFPRYIPAGSGSRWIHAHNDYLQLLIEGGVVAALLVVWLAWGYGRRALRRLRSSSPVSPARLGLVIGVLSLTAHAFIDFNHQIPGNALAFLAMSAFLLPVVHAKSRESRPAGAATRVLALLLFVPLLATYGFRSVTGVRAGLNLETGLRLSLDDEFSDAAPVLERAAVGYNRLRGLRMAAQARIDRWDGHVYRRGPVGADRTELILAARDFLECRCVAPASRWSMEGLGEVYDGLEWIGREQRALEPFGAVDDPWDRVGRHGRVAVGMMRNARDFAPYWYRLHGKLALTLWSYGLDGLSRESVRASARSFPYFWRHWYPGIDDLPAWFAEDFADASWEALEEVSLFPRQAHLIDLGKLERRNGNHEKAMKAFNLALDIAGDDLRIAEAGFHLGLSLIAVDRVEEGIQRFKTAGEHPRFKASAMKELAWLAERLGDDEGALEYYRRLRWDDPENLESCLRFATVARRLRDWPAALEALRWAELKHRRDIRPVAAMVETSVEMGDLAAARAAMPTTADWPDEEAEVRRLERLIRLASEAARR